MTGQGDPAGMRASVLMIPEEEVWRPSNQFPKKGRGLRLGWGGNPLPKAVAGVGVCVLCVSQGLGRDETSLSWGAGGGV